LWPCKDAESGSKNKLTRLRENETFPNVIQPERERILAGLDIRGNWKEQFAHSGPITLELGCGKGEYTLELARRYPERNFIGIDIKGARLWRGAKTALEERLGNVCFLRMQIELIDRVFSPGEVDEIWITFPDPQIKFKRTKHRLTNPDFLQRYGAILRDSGTIHLKTDSEFLHGYTLGLLQGMGGKVVYANHDVYRNHGAPDVVTEVQTFYEKQYLSQGKAITYLQFRLD
jgi:tRNA (guanine-N7-)-methyltransferase